VLAVRSSSWRVTGCVGSSTGRRAGGWRVPPETRCGQRVSFFPSWDGKMELVDARLLAERQHEHQFFA